MRDDAANYPARVPDASRAPKYPKFMLVDLLVLTACSALGLALFRWVDPHGYAPVRMDVEWLVVYGLLPLLFGFTNLGQAALLLLHFGQGRRREPISGCECAGLATSIAIVLMFTLGSMVANSRGGSALLMLLVLAAVVICGCVALLTLTRQIAWHERLRWPEVLGQLAAIIPTVWLVHGVVVSVPFC